MQSLIQANIFFFITSVVVIIFATVLIVAAIYVVRILHSVRYIVDKIKKESDYVSEDIAELRGRIKDGGVTLSGIARTLASFFFSKATSRRKRKPDHHSE